MGLRDKIYLNHAVDKAESVHLSVVWTQDIVLWCILIFHGFKNTDFLNVFMSFFNA